MAKNVTLLPHHQKELERSGININYAYDCGIRSIIHESEARQLLNRHELEMPPPPYLAFEYASLEENSLGAPFFAIKPDSPLPKMKYMRPQGEPNRLYVPRTVLSLINDEKTQLIITEGEKKTLCAASHGYRAVGISGANNWRAKYLPTEESIPLKEFNSLLFNGRKLIIVLDSDIQDNWVIQLAENGLADFLRSRGAEVFCARLPRK
jgi:hypothetical protein